MRAQGLLAIKRPLFDTTIESVLDSLDLVNSITIKCFRLRRSIRTTNGDWRRVLKAQNGRRLLHRNPKPSRGRSPKGRTSPPAAGEQIRTRNGTRLRRHGARYGANRPRAARHRKVCRRRIRRAGVPGKGPGYRGERWDGRGAPRRTRNRRRLRDEDPHSAFRVFAHLPQCSLPDRLPGTIPAPGKPHGRARRRTVAEVHPPRRLAPFRRRRIGQRHPRDLCRSHHGKLRRIERLGRREDMAPRSR